MKYSIEWLKNEIKEGKKHTLLGFWGDKADSPQERIYSNFHKSGFTVPVVVDENGTMEEITFTCNEQFFMYCKALLFKDMESVSKLLVPNNNPAEYKEIGRRVKNYDDYIWSQRRYGFMKEGLYYKFTQNNALKRQLLMTGNKVLVETSPFDEIWGIRLGKRNRMGKIDKTWLDVNNWRGSNLLGFALMEVRDQIRAEELANK